MDVIIKEVEDKDKDGKMSFVKFPLTLYKDNPYYVPSLFMEELETLNEDKNPAFEMCEKKMFLAYRNNVVVGRICAIINYKANEVWNVQNGRFSFCDFIDDDEVVDALFDAAETWLKEKGMKAIIGPAGFSGLDHEGLLIEGFEELTTMASLYNYPYYQTHIEKRGFKKEVDAKEYKVTVPETIPERHKRIADIAIKRNNLKILKVKNLKQVQPYVYQVFHLLNKTYEGLYGFVPLSNKQIDYYVNMYTPLLRWDYVTIVLENETDKVIGFGISMPSLSKGLQKAKGKLFPFGWFHLFKSIYFEKEIVELLLIGVDPEYQGKGVNAIIFADIIDNLIKFGVKYTESNPELEVNSKVNSLWDGFEFKQHKKRRFYKKELI